MQFNRGNLIVTFYAFLVSSCQLNNQLQFITGIFVYYGMLDIIEHLKLTCHCRP